MMWFVFMRPGSRTLLWIVTCFLAIAIYGRDRGGGVRDGVLVAIKTELQALHRLDLKKQSIELIVVEIKTPNCITVILYTFYRPPGSSPEILHDLNSSIHSNAVSSRIVLLNVILPYIDWSIDLPVSFGIGSQVVNNIFCELVGDNSLQQFVTGPTHISGSKLDALLCNGPEIITEVLTSTPEQSGFSTDHFILVFTILLKSKRPKPVRRHTYDFKRGNFGELRSLLSACLYGNRTLSAVDYCIPTKTVRDTNLAPWIDSEVCNHRYIRKKYGAHRKYRLNK